MSLAATEASSGGNLSRITQEGWEAGTGEVGAVPVRVEGLLGGIVGLGGGEEEEG